MKTLFTFLSLILLLAGCQQKQFYSSCPEIDMIKKADAAYFSGDWATFRSMFADTAKVNNNTWLGGEISPDQFIETLKTGLASYTEYHQGESPFYEMIIDDKGQKFVHAWWQWIGTHKNGKKVTVVVHVTAQFAGDKIGWLGAISDSLPGYLAEQPSDSTVMK